jgi:Ca2+-binding EF-hand superfamily protein
MAEFSKMMKEQGSNLEEIQVAFTAIDQDGAGVIKYSEFISAVISEQE